MFKNNKECNFMPMLSTVCIGVYTIQFCTQIKQECVDNTSFYEMLLKAKLKKSNKQISK